MFGKKTPPTTSPRSTTSTTSTETIIGSGVKVEGALTSPTNVYIDGEFSGEINCKKTVMVNSGARIKAAIEANCVIVHGEVVGNIHAIERIEVGTTGKIKGDVKAGAARVSEGGTLDGNCVIIPEGKSASAPSASPSASAAPSTSSAHGTKPVLKVAINSEGSAKK